MVCCKDKSFLRFKLARFFDIVDFDNNGTYTKEDLIHWGDKGMERFEQLGYEVTDDHRKMVAKLFGPVYNRFTFYGIMVKNKKRYVNFLSFFSQMPGFGKMTYSVMKDAHTSSLILMEAEIFPRKSSSMLFWVPLVSQRKMHWRYST